ncbi:hypothetical protein Tco_1221198 [Tanacetum coccineum]
MSSPKFAETHNVVAFLEKPKESDGFTEIIDFLKASSVSYALTVNPVIYTSCIEQFWATAKSSIRRDIHLDDAGGTDCLPTATIFEELARMGLSAKSTAWNEFSSTMASLIICLATNRKFNLSKYIFDAMVKHLDGGVKFLLYPRFLQVFINQQLGDMSHHKKTFVNPFHTKKIFANMKREGKDFSRKVTPLFDSMLVQVTEEVGEDSIPPTDSTQIPIIDQPSTSSQPKKKQKSRRKQRKEAKTAHAETEEEEHFNTPSNDPLPSGEDSMQLNELMALCTQLQQQVLDLEKAKSDQAIEIASLKKRVDKLEKRRQRMHPNEDQENLGALVDASKQGRSIEDIDDLMFDTGVLEDDEMHVEAKVDGKDEHSTKPDDSTAGEAVTTVVINDSAVPTSIEEIFGSVTNSDFKAAKPKDEKKAKLFIELMEKRRKHFAALRAQEKRNRPPTRQKRTKLSTYLKAHGESKEQEGWLREKLMGAGKKLLGGKEQERNNRRILKDNKKVEEEKDYYKEHLEALWRIVKAKYGDTRPENKFERVLWGDLKVMFEPDKRSDVWRILQRYMVTIWKLIDSSRVYFVRRNLKIQKMNIKFRGGLLGLKRLYGFFEVTTAQYTHQQLKHKNFKRNSEAYERRRVDDDFKPIDDDTPQSKADGSSKNYKIFSEMLDDFDRQDVIDLHRLVNERYETTSPEVYDLLLWGDLKTLFDPNEEDEIWKNQQDYNLISWRLFDSYGVHILLMNTGVAIHIMIEKKYPLTQEMLLRMLNRRLEVNYESEMAFELLKFTRSQLQK